MYATETNMNTIWCEPLSTANEISYKSFCLMGALVNPRLAKRERQNGSHIYFTYHLRSY